MKLRTLWHRKPLKIRNERGVYAEMLHSVRGGGDVYKIVLCNTTEVGISLHKLKEHYYLSVQKFHSIGIQSINSQLVLFKNALVIISFRLLVHFTVTLWASPLIGCGAI